MSRFLGSRIFGTRYLSARYLGGVADALFPAQFGWVRFIDGASNIVELCLVALEDAPAEYIPVEHSSGRYALYVVDPADPNASVVGLNWLDATLRRLRLKT